MAVPAVFTVSTSPSPANVPPTMFTVALTRSRLPGSLTVTALDSVAAAPPCVNAALVATFDKVGGWFTAAIDIVVVTGVLGLSDPACGQRILRVGTAREWRGLAHPTFLDRHMWRGCIP